MYTHCIEIKEIAAERDAYNDVVVAPMVHVATVWSAKTENGGATTTVASRIVHENEVVYTMRWRPDVRAGQYVVDGDECMKIESKHDEGRRQRIHLKCKRNEVFDK